MLTVNPAKRVTAAEALRHPWICVSYLLLLYITGVRLICFADRTTAHTSGNSSIDTSLIHDIYCGTVRLVSP